MRPLHDRVLVKRCEAVNMAGGLYLPEAAKTKPSEAVVIAVGTGKRGEDGTVHPLQVKEGDRVLFGKFAGTEIQVNGEDHLVLREDEIFGVLDE